MYFVYLKKKAQNQGANFPGDAAGGLCGVALTRGFPIYRGDLFSAANGQQALKIVISYDKIKKDIQNARLRKSSRPHSGV